MLAVVADQVLQCKTVMGSDEINARPRPPTAVSKDIGGAGNA
jgi:hypothetical protein